MVWIALVVTLVAAAVAALAVYSKHANRTDRLSTHWIRAHRADIG